MEDVFEHLYYCEESASCLRYKTSSSNKSRVNGAVAGNIVVGTKGIPYWVVWINGKKYLGHRCVVALNGTELDRSLIIDHKDGNSVNNKISNLRVVILN